MSIPAEAFLPFFSGATSMVVAGTFFILWAQSRYAHLLWFCASFALIGLVLVSVGVQVFTGPTTIRFVIVSAMVIASVVCLITACLMHAERVFRRRFLVFGGGVLWGVALTVYFSFGISSVVYLPFIAGLCYGVCAGLYWKRRSRFGYPVLIALFGTRALIHMPWFWIQGTPATVLIYGFDQFLIVTIGLVIIVLQLLDERARVEAANRQLIDQAKALEALNEQLNVERQLAFSASSAKSVFLANMSHELRTPLNAVIGFSEMISRMPPGQMMDRIADYGRDISVAGRQLLRFIDQILELSRVGEDGIGLERGALDIDALLREAVSGARKLADRSDFPVEVRVAPNAGTVIGDEHYLRNILTGVVARAANRTKGQGRVFLRAEATPAARIRIVIRDEGPSVSAEALAEIFEPFPSTDNALIASEHGLDLSLPVAKRLIEAHGGLIEVAEGDELGTAIIIELPRLTVAA